MSSISLEGFRELLKAGSVRNVTVHGGSDGFAVLIQVGMEQRALASQREQVRTWKRLETLAEFLKGMGVPQFRMDLTHWEPGQEATLKKLQSSRSKKEGGDESA